MDTPDYLFTYTAQAIIERILYCNFSGMQSLSMVYLHAFELTRVVKMLM